MAEPPYRINERRRWAGGARNNLFEAATPTRQRRRIPRTDNDTKSSVSDYGWRELLSGSRFLFSNFGPIRGAIFQMANYAVGCGFNVQYRGANRAWGEQMEEAIAQHDKICDIRGGNYDFRSALILDLVSIIRDGDTGFLLTETENGYPLYQSIASHRLASGRDGSSGEVTSGRFSGFSICHGVIQNAFGRPVGYRICDEGAPDEFTDIPADSFGHRAPILRHSVPVYQTQARRGRLPVRRCVRLLCVSWLVASLLHIGALIALIAKSAILQSEAIRLLASRAWQITRIAFGLRAQCALAIRVSEFVACHDAAPRVRWIVALAGSQDGRRPLSIAKT